MEVTVQSPRTTTTGTMAKPVGKTGVLLVNLGTPDSPSVPDVRKYLREFLMDGRVIDFPYLARFVLVNGIIAPFRAPKSAKIYRELWTENGSPLKYYGHIVTRLVQEQLGDEYEVRLAMRYQSPSIDTALTEFKTLGLNNGTGSSAPIVLASAPAPTATPTATPPRTSKPC